MGKSYFSAEHMLQQLGELSSYLTGVEGVEKDCFQKPLEIMQRTMGFHMSVLYKIANLVESDLILQVTKIFDPKEGRWDLMEGAKVSIDLTNPEKIYINEANSFKNKNISSINVPGAGCDIVGFVYLPDSFGGGYLFGGDYFGKESAVRDYEISLCEVMCNLLSSILMKAEFEQLAIFDSLTGLFNSRHIKEELRKAIKRHQRKKKTSTALVIADIDYFKKINDEYGHIQGDSILEEVGKIISSTMRADFDIAGRYGGEEFLFIFEETDENSAFKIVERLREKIGSYNFQKINKSGLPVSGEFINLTMSFGISCLGEGAEIGESKELLSMADSALYKSKNEGRNRVTISN